MFLKISEIVVYPVKSLAGNHHSEAEIVATGFRDDRGWMIVDEQGVFITQRQHPSMSLIRTEVLERALQLTLPGLQPVEIPTLDEGPGPRVEVWEQPCEAVDQGARAAELLSEYLGRPCRLVRMSSAFRRQIKAKYHNGDDASLGFSDSMPFLLTSQASLDDLNGRLTEPIEMDRFRPNLVVSGGAAFQEDGWKRIRIGETRFCVAKSCVRCEITTVDQSTGIKGIEPLETLGTYRAGPKGVLFGRHLVHEGRGTIRLGDPVEVLE